jgi:hypothetical protein
MLKNMFCQILQHGKKGKKKKGKAMPVTGLEGP